ncbi:hypothetical protein HDV04_005996 [Boothiomyces sp. JEL0838]|nr:hypothetical protein HDV04_005996 [Boothiomyces sp. JEL0838]
MKRNLKQTKLSEFFKPVNRHGNSSIKVERHNKAQITIQTHNGLDDEICQVDFESTQETEMSQDEFSQIPIEDELLEKIGKLASEFKPFNQKLDYTKAGTISLSSTTISYLLAAAFLNQIKKSTLKIDFSTIHSHPTKLQFFMKYFENVDPSDDRQVVFERVVMQDFPDWQREMDPLVQVETTLGRMEYIDGALIDFANRRIGGGVLSRGAVQEEIMFLCRPECIAARYFTEPLLENEALVIRNARIYSDYEGYAKSLSYKEYENNCYVTDIIAIDALRFEKQDSLKELRKDTITREINKAYVGFAQATSQIVTGNWGCGAFNGNKELKFLIQLIAATKAGKKVVYSTFEDGEFEAQVVFMYKALIKKRITNGQLFRLLTQYRYVAFPDAKRAAACPTLFEWIYSKLK